MSCHRQYNFFILLIIFDNIYKIIIIKLTNFIAFFITHFIDKGQDPSKIQLHPTQSKLILS